MTRPAPSGPSPARLRAMARHLAASYREPPPPSPCFDEGDDPYGPSGAAQSLLMAVYCLDPETRIALFGLAPPPPDVIGGPFPTWMKP